MTLPVVTYPEFPITIPSTKEKKKFRPFAVGEEKILLMGQQSKEPKDMYNAVKQVLLACAVDPIDLGKLAPFDFDYMFIKLRAMSVSNIVDVKYIDQEDDERYEVQIDLNEVDVHYPEGTAEPVVNVDDKIKVKLKYPTMEMMDEILEELSSEEEVTPSMIVDQLITKAIDVIISGDDIYPASEASKEDLEKFVNSLPRKPYDQIRKFFEMTPQVKHTISYTTKGGTVRTIELNGLTDFFIFA